MALANYLHVLVDVLFIAIFVIVLTRVVRRPSRTLIDTALLFGTICLAALFDLRNLAFGPSPQFPILTILPAIFDWLIPYFLLRLLDDFADVPRWLQVAAIVGAILSIAGFLAEAAMPSDLILVIQLVYFVGLTGYVTFRFAQSIPSAVGVTRKRLQAVAVGSGFLAIALVIIGVAIVLPGEALLLALLFWFAGALAALSFFAGFTPPAFLWRAWREPELRIFLERIATLSRQTNAQELDRELEKGAALTMGVPIAMILRWNEDAGVLRGTTDGQEVVLHPGEGLAGQSFLTQAPLASDVLRADYPELYAAYRDSGITAGLAAPMSLGSLHLGVLAVYANHPSLFVEDDLAMVSTLALQAAVILENRTLIDETARLHAREEAFRLKDQFISAAAHELKTPLTVFLGQAQLLERRARNNPELRANLEGIERMIRESKRLDQLIAELLEAAREEPLPQERPCHEVDLVAEARTFCPDQPDAIHRCAVEADGPVIGCFDPVRIGQLLHHLVENAVVYSPFGGEIRIRVTKEGNDAYLTITDQGIGIPPQDIPHLFQRFNRASNVDEQRFPGMGLGLFISRRIVEGYGGNIWVTSPGLGKGAT
ncbi:MAG TPA: HAMP domain-containing sensor histidine kinase, partial [Chloroflexota bacterium]|nr:HAMP domain-containing sensor histidine kinase [Chloroflexota bacterium]